MAPDRTGWTPLQVAQTDHAAAEARLHDLRNEFETASVELRSELEDLDPNLDVVRRLRRRCDDLAAQVEAARVRVNETYSAYMAVRRYSRRMFADELGIAPDTLSGYVSRRQAPQPDSAPGDIGHPWWLGTTVRAYASRNKRPGARADIAQKKDGS